MHLSLRRRTALLLASILLLTGVNTVHAATVRVGPASDPACEAASITLAAAMLNGIAGPHQIRVSSAALLTEPQLISNLDVDVVGGYADCSAPSPNAGMRSQIGPASTASERLLRVESNATIRSVQLRNLHFQGPAPAGAIVGEGPLDLVLEDVSVVEAGGTTIGGGGLALLSEAWGYLRGDTRILDNEAFLGGGVSCTQGRVAVESGAVLISGNRAQIGGGMALDGCRLRWETDALSSEGGIKGNRAESVGGGLFASDSAIGGDDNGEGARSVVANFAGFFGGGIALVLDTTLELPDLDLRSNSAGDAASPSSQGNCGGLSIEGSSARLQRFRIEGNTAWRSGAAVCLQEAAEFVVADPTPCAAGRCRSVSFNRAGLGGGTSDGGAFRVGDDSFVLLEAARIEANVASFGAAFHAIDDDALSAQSTIWLSNSLVVGNQASVQSTFSLQGIDLRLEQSTLAGNASGANLFGDSGGSSMQLLNSIIVAPVGTSVLSAPLGIDLVTRCVIAHEAASLQFQGGDAVVAEPGFVDPAAGDCRLGPDSPAIDACATLADRLSDRDASGIDRPIDLESVPDALGPWDAGAHELQLGAIFGDSFE